MADRGVAWRKPRHPAGERVRKRSRGRERELVSRPRPRAIRLRRHARTCCNVHRRRARRGSTWTRAIAGSSNRHFCGSCGSPVFAKAALAPGKFVVKAGTLDSMEGLRPKTEIYTDHAVKWLAPEHLAPEQILLATEICRQADGVRDKLA
jgi:hypothetical protein